MPDDLATQPSVQTARRPHDHRTPPSMTLWIELPPAFVPLLIDQARARAMQHDEYALQLLISVLTTGGT